jgi:putative copper resistance protein D
VSEVESLLIGMRFVQYAALMILFGSSLFPYYALRANEKNRRLRNDVAAFVQNIALFATLAALLSAVGWLACEAVLMSGDANGYRESDTVLTVLNDTQFGRIWRWRLILLMLLSLFFAWRVLGRRTPLTGSVLVSGIVLVASLAGVGHGAMGTGYDAWIHLGNQAIHLLAAAVWVGGLLSLFFVTWRARRSVLSAEVLARALRRFSAVGFAAVLLIVASGLLNSWFLVGSIHVLLHTTYGHVLIAKVSFFLCMIALALFNRLRVLPRLAHAADGDGSLSLLLRSVAIEQVFAVLVVASVSILGTLPPALEMPGMAM